MPPQKKSYNLVDRLAQPLKAVAQVTLSDTQKDVFRNAVNLRFFSPELSKNLVLILGCQRSGTTLLLLMLQAHSKVKGVDETALPYSLPFPSSPSLFYRQLQRQLICLKLPDHIANLDYIARYFPHAKILWTVRHPHNVVSSMRLLENAEGNWIQRCAERELIKLSPLFPEINALHLQNLDDISLGSYVWFYKNLAIALFKQKGLNVFDFKYEDLLENPAQMLEKILKFVNLEWNDQVLEYYKFHQKNKTYPGNTKGDKPLDKSRKNSQVALTEAEKATITQITQKLMIDYGY